VWVASSPVPRRDHRTANRARVLRCCGQVSPSIKVKPGNRVVCGFKSPVGPAYTVSSQFERTYNNTVENVLLQGGTADISVIPILRAAIPEARPNMSGSLDPLKMVSHRRLLGRYTSGTGGNKVCRRCLCRLLNEMKSRKEIKTKCEEKQLKFITPATPPVAFRSIPISLPASH